ncbi:(2Fe-2S)-binding protein [Luteimonas sp. SJ-92]|uniref:(2Fe-2S)-binding protein n=1 Tax=Luteimonas salinisoli TaxID=2752307 RepID=A0A853J8R6_9GAMM|nr:(2Fe-2S)-binding protein [Luteimonas salinisoli]
MRLVVDGRALVVLEGSSVAAAIAAAGGGFRRSCSGQPRAPVCGIGVCFECRVEIDGRPQQRACMIRAREGMEVVTDG